MHQRQHYEIKRERKKESSIAFDHEILPYHVKDHVGATGEDPIMCTAMQCAIQQYSAASAYKNNKNNNF